MRSPLRPTRSQSIHRHGAETYPHECCGALLEVDGVIVATFSLAEHDGRGLPHGAFSSGPNEYRRAEALGPRAAEATLAGFYHSHPDHPARPSQTDLDNAWPNFVYVIVSVAGRHAARHHLLASARGSLGIRPRRPEDMAHRVLIPTPLRPYTAQQDVVEADGRTVGDVLSALTSHVRRSAAAICIPTTASCAAS